MYHSHGHSSLSNEAHASAPCSPEPTYGTGQVDVYGVGMQVENFPTAYRSCIEALTEAHETKWGERHRDGHVNELARKAEESIASEAFSPMSSAEDPSNSRFLARHFEKTTTIGEVPLEFSESTHLRYSPPWSQLKLRNDQSTSKLRAENDLPDVLLCEHGGCPMVFAGRYRRGSLQRHMRLKHRCGDEVEKLYECIASPCDKIFKRQDARLKHYRLRHPELRVAPPVSRHPYSKRRREDTHEEANARAKEIPEAMSERLSSNSLENTSMGEDVRSETSPVTSVNYEKTVIEEPNLFSSEFNQEDECDATIPESGSTCSAGSSRQEEVGWASISMACDSDTDLETEIHLVTEEAPGELDGLLNSVENLENQHWNDNTDYQSHGGGAQDGRHTTRTRNSSIRHSETDVATPRNHGRSKRPRSDEHGEDEDREGNGGGRKVPKYVPTIGEVLVKPRALACPFAKHNPLAHTNCWTHKANNIAHLRQHLKRDHSYPKHYCPVCGREFEGNNASTEKDRHIVERLCVPDVTAVARWHGITADQEQQIKRKPTGMDDDQYWYYIFGRLFTSEPPQHPYHEDFAILALRTFGRDLTENLADQLTAQSEQISLARHELQGSTAPDSDSITETLRLELLNQVNRAIESVITQIQEVGRSHSRTSEGSVLGASTHHSDSGYASLDTNFVTGNGAPTASSPEYASHSEASVQPQELFDGQTLDQMTDAHFQSQWDHEVYETDNRMAEQPPMISVADHDNEAQYEVIYDFLQEVEERHGSGSEPYVNPADVENQQ